MGCLSDSQKQFVTPNTPFFFFIIMGDCGITLCHGNKNISLRVAKKRNFHVIKESDIGNARHQPTVLVCRCFFYFMVKLFELLYKVLYTNSVILRF